MNSDIPILRYDRISRSFFGIPVLRDVEFSVRRGRVLGLIGENGAGKSTLMNILGGVLRPDSGQMLLDGGPYEPRGCREATRHGIAFVHQELNLFTNLSIAENLHIDALPYRSIAGIRVPLVNHRAMIRKSRALLEAVDLRRSPTTLVEHLAPGERQLVEIAKAIGSAARIVILDEPTTSLTAPETERLFAIIRRLRDRGVAVIYISHNLEDVFALCDDLLVLRDGQVVGRGSCSEFTLARAISLMVGRSIDQLYPVRTGYVSGEKLLEVSGLTQPDAVQDISFDLHCGEVLGVAGLMGAGRTELARILFGLDPFERGEIRVRGQVHTPSPRRSVRCGMAFVTESRREDGLLMDASVSFNAALVSLPSFGRMGTGWIDRNMARRSLCEAAHATCLSDRALETKAVKALSGGNQQKVVLAKWLMGRPSIFMLDEPTRGIDIGAKQEVYRVINGLADQGAGILMISSEIEELLGMCDRILVMAGGRIRDCISRPEFDRERILRSALQGGRPS